MAILTPIIPTASSISSSIEKAEAAKQKGNDLFKKGSYAESIGLYSEAHLLDPSSPIYPLNRAQAYINLSKFADAERDCSKSIALDGKTTKAWFRRGVARRGLGDWKGAREDFARVLKLDPKMATSVKMELEKVKKEEEAEVLKKNKGKKVVPPPASSSSSSKPNPTSSSSSVPTKPSTSASPPKSYLIPIKMIYPSTTPPQPAPSLPTISTPPSSSPPAPSKPDPTSSIFPTKPKPKPSPPAATFASLQSARNAKPTLPLPLPSPSPSPNPPPATNTKSKTATVHPKPTSAHALHKTLLAIGDLEEGFEFLVSLPPSLLPAIIGSSLEPPLFALLLAILESTSSSSSKESIVKALEGTQRFSLAKMMTKKGEERWVGLGGGK